MLILPTHSGFHDLFLNYSPLTNEHEAVYILSLVGMTDMSFLVRIASRSSTINTVKNDSLIVSSISAKSESFQTINQEKGKISVETDLWTDV